MSKLRVAVIINFMTSYREGFYRRLLSDRSLDVTIFCHELPAESSLISIHHKFPGNVEIIRGFFFRGEAVVFSCLNWWRIFRGFDVVYIEGNPRYVSFALLATALSISRRNIVLWTMVHSFRNAVVQESLRIKWMRLFKKLLVYSEGEVSSLKNEGFTTKYSVVSINNSLDQDRIGSESQQWGKEAIVQWKESNALGDAKIVLSCARLEEKNRFFDMVRALPTILEQVPNIKWVVVGDGKEKEKIKQEAERIGVASSIRFLGGIHEEASLAPWFLSADILVHPGAIGLTVLHAFGYGLPVVTHGNAARHGPEFSAFVSGKTGLSYQEGSVSQLAERVVSILRSEETRNIYSQNAKMLVAEKWNMDVMVRRFKLVGGLSD